MDKGWSIGVYYVDGEFVLGLASLEVFDGRITGFWIGSACLGVRMYD